MLPFSDFFLWFSVVLLLFTVVFRKRAVSRLTGCTGWCVFAVFWASLLPGYAAVSDYTNVLLTAAAFAGCLVVSRAYAMMRNAAAERCASFEAFSDLSAFVVVICLLYFPFRMFDTVGNALISAVAGETVYVLKLLGFEVVREAFDLISYNGCTVRVILACTAIESIAAVAGLILAARAPAAKKIVALSAAVPVIYILNILRNVFVIAAYGDMWFGPNSFEIAHNYIAKAGSIAALFVMAFLLFRFMPALSDMIARICGAFVSEVRAMLKKTPRGD